jgi:dimethylargininase
MVLGRQELSLVALTVHPMSTRFTHGLARQVSRSLGQCLLRHLPRSPVDAALAGRQHTAYVRALEQAGVRVTVLPEQPEMPDSTFIEDPLVILDEVAVVCRPGAPTREPEAQSVEAAVAPIRPVHRIAAPATIEGGDVLRLGKKLYVGRSSRTNLEGIRRLEEIVRPFGYEVITVRVEMCLHLKTGVTSPSDGVLILNADWIDPSPFRGFEILEVPAEEPWGANTVAVNGRVLVSESSPRTADLLESNGMRVQRLDISELQKAEAGLTCLSVLFANPPV